MVQAPGRADALTIVDGTLSNGDLQKLACYVLPAHNDGDWVGTGLEFKDNTQLHISFDVGTYRNNPCFRLSTSLRDWNGQVPGADGRDSLWVTR